MNVIKNVNLTAQVLASCQAALLSAERGIITVL
jgi:hypothetical protein